MSDWIDWEWTEEKPYPETLGTLVWAEFGDGWSDYDEEGATPKTVGWWGGDESDQTQSSWFPSDDGLTIVAYKVVKNV